MPTPPQTNNFRIYLKIYCTKSIYRMCKLQNCSLNQFQ